MKTQYDRNKLEQIAFRWGNAWMRRLVRANASGKKETAPMAKSAREMCSRRGWEYEGSTLWEETTQVRGMFRDPVFRNWSRQHRGQHGEHNAIPVSDGRQTHKKETQQ